MLVRWCYRIVESGPQGPPVLCSGWSPALHASLVTAGCEARANARSGSQSQAKQGKEKTGRAPVAARMRSYPCRRRYWRVRIASTKYAPPSPAVRGKPKWTAISSLPSDTLGAVACARIIRAASTRRTPPSTHGMKRRNRRTSRATDGSRSTRGPRPTQGSRRPGSRYLG